MTGRAIKKLLGRLGGKANHARRCTKTTKFLVKTYITTREHIDSILSMSTLHCIGLQVCNSAQEAESVKRAILNSGDGDAFTVRIEEVNI